MPTVKVLERIDTFLDYGQPVRFEKGEILDGDLAVKALDAGWPVEIDVADPPVKKAPPPAPAKTAEPAPAKPKKAVASLMSPPAKAPAKTAAKKTAPPKRAAKKTTA